MKLHRMRRSRPVVSPSRWSINTVLLVVVFVATSGLVYHWGHVAGRHARSEAVYAAAATVRHAELPSEAAGGSDGSPSDDLLARTDGQIRCRENLEAAVSLLPPHAVAGVSDAESQALRSHVMDRLQRGLRVTLDEEKPGWTGVRISYADASPDRASELMRAVVQQYVETFRREWKRHTEKVHAGASAAANEARRRWQLTEAERQAFVDGFLQEDEKQAAQVAPVQTPEASSVPPAVPTRVENPEWSRLSRQQAWLERRRADLLLERMPAHPEVQGVEQELAELQQALSSTAQWIDPEESGAQPENRPAESPATPAPEAETDPEQVARQQSAARREIDRLGREAGLARSRYEQLAAVERAAWADHIREPEVDVSYIPPVEVASGGSTLQHLLSTSLLAGMIMMVGVGMFAAGAGMEPTLVTADQVSALLEAPVVATVTLPGLKPANSARHRVWLRLASCLGGATLIAACLGLLYRAIAG